MLRGVSLNIKLSICIPTYNRGKYLKDTIDSILTQEAEGIEIVISDNASTDNTGEVVKEVKKQTSIPIVYFKHSKNQGADTNYLKVIEIANGRYCWLLGSDDKLEPGAIEKMLKEIETGIDIFYVNNYNYDAAMSKKSFTTHSLARVDKDIVYTDYRSCVKDMGGMFGYISALIVNRDKWLAVKDVKQFIGSAYVHVYIVYMMLYSGSSAKYIHAPLIGWRSGNDSFLENGVFNRLRIDVEGYDSIAKKVFNEDISTRYINNIVIRQHVFFKIVGAKLNNFGLAFTMKALNLCVRHYKGYLIFWLKVFPVLFIPSTLLKGIRYIYRNRVKKKLIVTEGN
jgi:abequosyltransferase